MRAVTFDEHGAVRVDERPRPEPGAGQLLVRVRAAGLNNADLLQAAGHYPAPPGWPADVLGMELAGEVVERGAGCTGPHEVGARVLAVVGGGAQADYALVPEAVAMALPDGVEWAQAGALPEAAATAWDALFAQARLQPGDRLLVNGAAGGVGTIAVQLGAAAGAEVVASSRHLQHHPALRELGATVAATTDGAHGHGPFDVVLELVGGVNLGPNLDALNSRGRIVVVGIGGGRRAELDLRALMARRGTISGATLRQRSVGEHAEIARSLEHEVLPLLADGHVRVPLHATFPMDAATDAYASFTAGGKFGKVVLVGE